MQCHMLTGFIAHVTGIHTVRLGMCEAECAGRALTCNCPRLLRLRLPFGARAPARGVPTSSVPASPSPPLPLPAPLSKPRPLLPARQQPKHSHWAPAQLTPCPTTAQALTLGARLTDTLPDSIPSTHKGAR